MWHVQRDYVLNLECGTAEKRRWGTSLKSHSLSDAPCPFNIFIVREESGERSQELSHLLGANHLA